MIQLHIKTKSHEICFYIYFGAVFLLSSFFFLLSSCSNEIDGDTNNVFSKVLSLTSSAPLFEVSYTSTTLTLISPIGPTSSIIEKMVERPIETKDLIKLTVWSGENYRLETERLAAEMPSYSIFNGLPNPDPIGSITKWEDGKIEILTKDGQLQHQEYQEQPNISEIVSEMNSFINNYPINDIPQLMGIPANFQIENDAIWQEYINDPKAIITNQPNGLSSIHVELGDFEGKSELAAIVVFHEKNGLKLFNAVQIYNQVTGNPISSTLYRFGEETNGFLPILGYECRTIIDIGENSDVELNTSVTFENFNLKINF